MVNNLLRARDGNGASVSFSELLFDLIYVFAVTQRSQYLLHHLTLLGAVQTLILWFAVWLGWQYTAWVTNWFDPDAWKIRLLLFILMLSGLFLAAMIPDAFGVHGWGLPGHISRYSLDEQALSHLSGLIFLALLINGLGPLL